MNHILNESYCVEYFLDIYMHASSVGVLTSKVTDKVNNIDLGIVLYSNITEYGHCNL